MMPADEIGVQRLRNHRIAGERLRRPEDVVRWMGALQAQDYRQSLWAIGLRLQTATVAAVEQAIAQRRIVLTWPLRGTIHVVPAEDVAWMLALSAPRTLPADRRRLQQLELNDAIIERGKTLFHDALRGGKCLTRQAMMALLADTGIDPTGQRGYHILWHVAQAGLICFGPMQDKQQTFVLLDEWIPAPRRLSREESLAELVGRYFTSHGPATLHDFAHWSGLTIADATAGLDAIKPRVTSTRRHGKVYWMGDGAGDCGEYDGSGLYLLPGFDEYVLGYRDRGDVLAPEHATKIVPGNNGIFLPAIVSAGRVVGTWKRTVKKNALDITLTPFGDCAVTTESIAAAARRYGEFMGLPVACAEINDAS